MIEGNARTVFPEVKVIAHRLTYVRIGISDLRGYHTAAPKKPIADSERPELTVGVRPIRDGIDTLISDQLERSFGLRKQRTRFQIQVGP